MNGRRALITAAAVGLALILAFPLRGIVYQLLIVPLAYLLWVLGLVYRSFDQGIWWIVLIVVVVYLPLRYRFIRQATAGRRFVRSTDDLDLFALRAMARQPLHRLARISEDPVGAWRRGDPRVVRDLAALELRDSGLSMAAISTSADKPPR